MGELGPTIVVWRFDEPPRSGEPAGDWCGTCEVIRLFTGLESDGDALY